jgi:hypothetical protein
MRSRPIQHYDAGDAMTEPSLPQMDPANAYRAPAADAGPLAPSPTPAVPLTKHSAGMRMVLPVGRSGWAIAAGYLGLFAFIVYPAPLALIASLLAYRDFRRHPEKHGRGRATFGLIMGVLGTAVLCFFGVMSLTR